MASATLIALGDPAGFPPLAALLADTSDVRGARPPRQLNSYVSSVLFQYVAAGGAPSFGDSADPSAEALAWQTWLAANSASLQFSPNTGVWTLP
jgi:hypothetical protein